MFELSPKFPKHLTCVRTNTAPHRHTRRSPQARQGVPPAFHALARRACREHCGFLTNKSLGEQVTFVLYQTMRRFDITGPVFELPPKFLKPQFCDRTNVVLPRALHLSPPMLLPFELGKSAASPSLHSYSPHIVHGKVH